MAIRSSPFSPADFPFSIKEKLEDLGYKDEDFDPRYDETSWKWKLLLNQTRPLSERGM